METVNLDWLYYRGMLIKAGLSILVFVAFWVAGGLASKGIRKIADRLHEGKREVVHLFASVARFLFLLLGIVSALGTAGMDVSALVAGLGLTGFALGFALKDALSNLLAGTLILFYQPFSLGDRIEVGGVEGAVKEINLRYTVIRGPGKEYLVPNAAILNSTVTLHGEAGGTA